MKRPLLRQAAEHDIERAFAYYSRQANIGIAAAFVGAIDVALQHIELHPGTGSPRYCEMLDVPGLRHWLVSRFPYAVFYVEHDDYLDIIRVLHQQSDIPAQLQCSPPDNAE
jgi:toxin ParE1/3/4